MSGNTAHPGPRDGSGPLVWILGGVCVGVLVLIIKLSLAPGDHDQAFIYVIVGGLAGLLLRTVMRRRRGRPGNG